jgi:hypothetical protein
MIIWLLACPSLLVGVNTFQMGGGSSRTTDSLMLILAPRGNPWLVEMTTFRAAPRANSTVSLMPWAADRKVTPGLTQDSEDNSIAESALQWWPRRWVPDHPPGYEQRSAPMNSTGISPQPSARESLIWYAAARPTEALSRCNVTRSTDGKRLSIEHLTFTAPHSWKNVVG